MYNVYLFNMLFTKFLLTQILEILMVNKLLQTRCLFDQKKLSRRMQMIILFLIKKYFESQQKAILKINKIY